MEIIICVLICIIGALTTYIIIDRRHRLFIEDIIQQHLEDIDADEVDVQIDITVRPR